MSQKPNKERHQKIKTEIITNPTKFLPTIYLKPQVYEEYSTPAIIYGYTSKDQYYTTTTQTKTTTTKISNINYNYPSPTYYLNEKYENYNLEDNTIKYTSHTYTHGQTTENNQERKTFPNYEYQQVKENKIKNQKNPFGDFKQNMNNVNDIVYIERKTNYPQSNNLNLNNIYDISYQNSKNNEIKTTKNINKNIHHVNPEYQYYNNNMYIVQSGSSGKKITQNVVPNNIYYNEFNLYNELNNNQQGNKINEKIINNKIDLKTNMNYIKTNNKINPKTNINIINTNNKVNINYKTNTNNKTNIVNTTNNKPNNNTNVNTNTNINNPTNLYMNAKIIINNKVNRDNNTKNNSEYSSIEQNNLVDNDNNMLNSVEYQIAVEEPSDNMRNKGKNGMEVFNNTMPNLKINNDINSTLNTIERKNYPIQAISAFEITFNNTTTQKKNDVPQQTKNNNPKKKNKNYIPMTTNNISLTNNNEENGNKIKIEKEIKLNEENIIKNNVNDNVKEDKKDKVEKNDIKKKIEDDKNNKIQNKINAGKYFDTYNGKIVNNQNEEQVNKDKTKNKKQKSNNNEGVDIKKLRQQFDLFNDNQFYNNTPPLQYKNNIYNNNIIPNFNQRNNRFMNEPNYANINTNNLNINNNNINNIQQKRQQKIINIIKEVKNDVNGENNIKVIGLQQPKKKRPVFKIPPSKKRAISLGKPLTFIHKYYDENFILEEDNEDIGSDNENKKNNKAKTIFREVTNVKKLIRNSKGCNEEVEKINNQNNDNININNNSNNINIEVNMNNINIEQSIKNMRLSHIRFSLESSNNPEDTINSTNNNETEEINDSQKDIVNIDSINMENKYIQNNNDLNCQIKTTVVSKVDFQSKDISDNLNKDKENLSNSNISSPMNSDSILEQKNSINNNIDINHLDSNLIEQNNIYANSNIINSEIYKEENINNNSNDLDMNLNIENEKKDENDDKRISLNIEGFDLDKYFQQEGVNKRNIEQKEVSDSLKTINLEENYKSQNSQIMIENEKQQNNLGNSNISNISNNDDNIKREESGEELIMIDDALKGSVHIPENIQDFVKKNNELYNDNK